MTQTILTYPEAASLLRDYAHRLISTTKRTEQVPLLEALGRVLAQPVTADRHHPPFDRSTRDGYAVQSAALNTGNWLPIVGTLRAGEPPTALPLAAGAALEIMTGAPVPAGADAVVMLEHVEALENRIRFNPGRTLRLADNIIPTGSEAHAGDSLVPAGTRLAPPHIAALAAVGATQVQVFARPRVAILATGDELVEIDDPAPLPYQIRNSNSVTLAAHVSLAGGEPQRIGIARDHLGALRTRLDQALGSCDLLLLSGGVSAGKYDLVEQALAERGALFHFTGVRIQPGKPAVFGEVPWSSGPAIPFFGLPGNPVSTMVTFLLFAAPMLRALASETDIAPRFSQAQLAAAESAAANLTRFLPARLDADWDHATVRRIPWQGSGDLAATAQSNCFVVLPPNTALDAGATVQVLLP